jgi:hypothetical protein
VVVEPPLPHHEVQRILRRLEPLTAERRAILVGGQAVSIWMRMLQPLSEELAAIEPVTSKDIDFEGGAPLGLNRRDVRDTADQLMVLDESREPTIPLWVMHPERCMESRVDNAIDLRGLSPSRCGS